MAAHVRNMQTALDGVPEFYARLAELERAVERAESGYSSLPAPSLEGAADQVPDGDRLQQTASRLLQSHALEIDSLERQFAAVQAHAQTISRVSVMSVRLSFEFNVRKCTDRDIYCIMCTGNEHCQC